MKLNQKIEIQFFLKGILRNLERCNTSNIRTEKNYNISNPLFIFEKKEKEDLLIQIIADLELEIHEEENGK